MRKPRLPDAWIVLSTFKPGEKGTKKLLRDWGARLVCVRYRYNPVRGTRLKTAEIVVGEAAWRRRRDVECVVEIRSWEKSLREQVVAAGGRWDREIRMWILAKKKLRELGLVGRARRLPYPLAAAPKHPLEANIHGNPKANRYGNLRSNASNHGNRP